jgi:hypothetical protein
MFYLIIFSEVLNAGNYKIHNLDFFFFKFPAQYLEKGPRWTMTVGLADCIFIVIFILALYLDVLRIK